MHKGAYQSLACEQLAAPAKALEQHLFELRISQQRQQAANVVDLAQRPQARSKTRVAESLGSSAYCL
jgi:ribosomal protein L29